MVVHLLALSSRSPLCQSRLLLAALTLKLLLRHSPKNSIWAAELKSCFPLNRLLNLSNLWDPAQLLLPLESLPFVAGGMAPQSARHLPLCRPGTRGNGTPGDKLGKQNHLRLNQSRTATTPAAFGVNKGENSWLIVVALALVVAMVVGAVQCAASAIACDLQKTVPEGWL